MVEFCFQDANGYRRVLEGEFSRVNVDYDVSDGLFLWIDEDGAITSFTASREDAIELARKILRKYDVHREDEDPLELARAIIAAADEKSKDMIIADEEVAW